MLLEIVKKIYLNKIKKSLSCVWKYVSWDITSIFKFALININLSLVK